MEKEQVLIKNIEFSKPLQLAGLVDYEEGRVVSRTLSQNPTLSLTVFAFPRGEEIGTHSAPGDAMVHVLDGEADVTIGGETIQVGAGEVVVMPKNIPHSLFARERFKMMLILVKPQKAG
ncbi:MAG: cupin domain-containing protein [Desulfovibrionales bacterium]